MSRNTAPTIGSLQIRLDPALPVPLYRQLYEEIRDGIVSGRIAPGSKLPATRSLAYDLNLSRTTVVQAVDQLKVEGYLSAHVGAGTRVVDVLPDRLMHVRRTTPGLPVRKTSPGVISRRGAEILSIPQAVRRAGREPRPFRLGIPGLDVFPRKLWNRLLIQRTRLTSINELDYGSPAGVQPLREAIARYAATARGVRCSPEQVMVVGGTHQGIGFAARMLLDPGDAAWLEEPGYLSARGALAAASARIVPVPVDAEGLVVERGIELAPDARLAYVTPSHQYPLGVTTSLRRRLELIQWAEDHQAWILEDDYDSEYRYVGRPLTSLHGLEGGNRVIYHGTFSKSVFPALRIGYIVVPEELIDAFRRARAFTDQHPPTLQQLVLADFIRGGHFARHLRTMLTAYEKRLRLLITELRKTFPPGFTVDDARAGLHVLLRVPAEISDVDVAREALTRGVEVSPLSLHYLGKPAENGVLLGFASAPEDAIPAAVTRLREAVEAAREKRDALP